MPTKKISGSSGAPVERGEASGNDLGAWLEANRASDYLEPFQGEAGTSRSPTWTKDGIEAVVSGEKPGDSQSTRSSSRRMEHGECSAAQEPDGGASRSRVQAWPEARPDYLRAEAPGRHHVHAPVRRRDAQRRESKRRSRRAHGGRLDGDRQECRAVSRVEHGRGQARSRQDGRSALEGPGGRLLPGATPRRRGSNHGRVHRGVEQLRPRGVRHAERQRELRLLLDLLRARASRKGGQEPREEATLHDGSLVLPALQNCSSNDARMLTRSSSKPSKGLSPREGQTARGPDGGLRAIRTRIPFRIRGRWVALLRAHPGDRSVGQRDRAGDRHQGRRRDQGRRGAAGEAEATTGKRGVPEDRGAKPLSDSVLFTARGGKTTRLRTTPGNGPTPRSISRSSGGAISWSKMRPTYELLPPLLKKQVEEVWPRVPPVIGAPRDLPTRRNEGRTTVAKSSGFVVAMRSASSGAGGPRGSVPRCHRPPGRRPDRGCREVRRRCGLHAQVRRQRRLVRLLWRLHAGASEGLVPVSPR